MTISGVVERVLCPILVRRDDELAVLEDALLAAHRGESRFVMVAGDAGIGKTRLITELAGSARKLGGAVLWGSCSEAELSLPYLPFVEAIGNYLAAQDVAALGERLGPARRELAQLFPQLSDGTPPEPAGDPAQAKLRLFEGVVALLAAASERQPVLLVVDDIHWADESTRELLDHLSRRLAALAALLVVTYRADELHRRHPLAPVLQSWRRSGLAETVKLEPLAPAGVAEMIRVMFDAPAIEADLRNPMFERSEGNPFVLEEMLKEAIERGDIVRTDAGWERRSLGDLEIPETVRDTILLRLQRLDEEHTTILQAAAVLGRSFDYPTLVAVSGADEGAVNGALEAAIGQQLIEEHPDAQGSYRWRHALTQEAIYTDMVMPRRQQLHSRAADALTAQPSMRSIDVAHHLLGAARFAEAVPVCLRSADEAERALAYGDAVAVLERALPHVTDPLERARALCAIGRLTWFNGQPVAAAHFLIDGVEGLESLGEPVEAARFRVYLGRCHWESSRSDLADAEYEAARSVLEAVGPSADLATAYVRIAGLRLFEFDYDGCVEAATRGMEVGEAADADFERTWAHAFLAMGLMGSDVAEGFAVSDAVYEEAAAKGYWLVASNTEVQRHLVPRAPAPTGPGGAPRTPPGVAVPARRVFAEAVTRVRPARDRRPPGGARGCPRGDRRVRRPPPGEDAVAGQRQHRRGAGGDGPGRGGCGLSATGLGAQRPPGHRLRRERPDPPASRPGTGGGRRGAGGGDPRERREARDVPRDAGRCGGGVSCRRPHR